MEQHVTLTSKRRLVCMILACTVLPAFSQNATWTGQVQCQLSVQTNGYTHQETQTWKLTGATPTLSGTIDVYPADWSSSGQGAVQQTTRTAQWTVNVQPMSAPLAVFIRSSDNRLVIKSYHSQLYSPAGVTGSLILPTQGSLQFPTNEWTLPVIEDSPTSVNVSGSATVAIAPNLLPLQTSSSPASTANCNWQFSKVSGGLPQPVIAAKTVATPTGVPTPTTTNTTISGIPLTSPTSKVVAVILGRTSDGATCPQPNPLPATNPGLSHAYQSTCSFKFSGNQWTNVASWSLPLDKYVLVVTVQPHSYTGAQVGSTSPPSYTCNLVEPQSPIGLDSVSGVGSLKDSAIGLPYFSVSAVQLQCATWTGVTYDAAATIVAIQIGAVN